MQHSVFKISNNEENVINLENLLSLWSSPLNSQRVDHEDRRLATLIIFFIITHLKYAMLNFDPHLKLLSTSAVHRNAIFRSRYQGLITKLCRLNTKTGKLKVVTLCNTMINVSRSFYGI